MAKPNANTNLIIAILAVAAIVLGYLYYQETQDNVNIKIDVPDLSIEKK